MLMNMFIIWDMNISGNVDQNNDHALVAILWQGGNMTATQARTTVISSSPCFWSTLVAFPQTFIQGNNGGKIMSTICQWVR